MSPENWWAKGVDALSRSAGMPVLSSGFSNAKSMTSLRNSNPWRKAGCCSAVVPCFCMWSRESGIKSCLMVKRGFWRLEKS